MLCVISNVPNELKHLTKDLKEDNKLVLEVEGED